MKFKDAAALAGVYPRLARHGMAALSRGDMLRFLGRKAPAHGGVNGHFRGEMASDLKCRPEGVRLKHRAGGNSVKVYDKQGSVPWVETIVNDPSRFEVYRGTEAQPQRKEWRELRKGVADPHRRAEVSRASNERYLEALSAVEQTTPLGALLDPVCKAVKWQGGRVRALRPFEGDDLKLLEAVSRGEFAVNGLRNRDPRQHLYGADPADAKERRRRAGKVTRQLRLPRAHGLIQKVPKTQRYLLTDKGRPPTAALLAARDADATKRLDLATWNLLRGRRR